MINVDRIYQRVLTLANKEQRGYITPQEFNLYANQAQMDIFEQYFYDLNQFLRIPGNSTTHADMVDILEEKISVFEVTATLALAINPNGVAGNLNALPRFYRLSNVRSGNTIMESVSRKDFRLFPNSPLTTPTTTRPIYMIDTINSPPGSIKAYSWWEFLKYAQKPYQYYADAYIMANSTWFNGLPADLQKIIMDVGKEVGTLSTDRIMDHGETVLKEFQDRGGVVTTLSGAEKAKFDKLMKDKVMPAMAKMIDADALKAAQEYAKNN